VEIKSAQADRFVKAPPAGTRALLLYGPDGGLVRERADAACRSVLGDDKDPFRYSELGPQALQDDKARLNDEAAALSLSGGQRVVRLRDLGTGHAPLFAAFLQTLPGEALIVVEAGDLPRKSTLVKLFEAAGPEAVAIACYRDEIRDIQRVVGEALDGAGLRASADALAFLSANLGSDRQLSRRELEKLLLYMGDSQAQIELADVQVCIGDSAALSLDDLSVAVAAGNAMEADRTLQRALQEGANPVAIIRAVSRYFQRLHLVSGQLATGASLDSALRSLRPPLFWKQKESFAAQVRAWNPKLLARALKALLEAERNCKRSGMPDVTLTSDLLMRITRVSPLRGQTDRQRRRF
jgi:DNA polymerase-3 subunit delta|tara:strand:- start:543 stop:1601 length:1059 start_codon:yes stop_codon:yes gene_type:complete